MSQQPFTRRRIDLRKDSVELKKSAVKQLTAQQLSELGILQEANRFFFHPIGLCMSALVDDDGFLKIEVQDYRDDPEGMTFLPASMSDPERHRKAENVEQMHQSKSHARAALLGYYGPQALVRVPTGEPTVCKTCDEALPANVFHAHSSDDCK